MSDGVCGDGSRSHSGNKALSKQLAELEHTVFKTARYTNTQYSSDKNAVGTEVEHMLNVNGVKRSP